jgi:hypothetical protein
MGPALLLTGLVFAHGAAADAPGSWQSPAARCQANAAALRIAPSLRPLVADLCRRAPTFRRQVTRLAADRDFLITVEQKPAPPTVTWRAHTSMTRVGGRLRSADVAIRPGAPHLVAELLGHEFEHILEQLDGVDLQRWVGRSGVYRVGSGAESAPIETARAQEVGRLVAREFASAAEMELTAARPTRQR